jgi:hypothetical protein
MGWLTNSGGQVVERKDRPPILRSSGAMRGMEARRDVRWNEKFEAGQCPVQCQIYVRRYWPGTTRVGSLALITRSSKGMRKCESFNTGPDDQDGMLLTCILRSTAV